MANMCYNTIVFYQEDEKNDRLKLLMEDLEKYVDYQDSESEGYIGKLFEAKGIDVGNMNTRAFISYLEDFSDHIHMELESAWRPMPSIHEKIAEMYDLKQVYMAEEPGYKIYVNTDVEGSYFEVRYFFSCSKKDIDKINWENKDISVYKNVSNELLYEDGYFEDFEDLMKHFKGFNVEFDTLEGLNSFLSKFGLKAFEYESDDSCYKDEEAA